MIRCVNFRWNSVLLTPTWISSPGICLPELALVRLKQNVRTSSFAVALLILSHEQLRVKRPFFCGQTAVFGVEDFSAESHPSYGIQCHNGAS